MFHSHSRYISRISQSHSRRRQHHGPPLAAAFFCLGFDVLEVVVVQDFPLLDLVLHPQVFFLKRLLPDNRVKVHRLGRHMAGRRGG